MAIFTVTTGFDVSQDNDAQVTLREAIEAAAGNDEADTIRFAQDVTVIQMIGAGASPGATVFNGFTIAAGEDLTIEGDVDLDGVGDVTISGSNATAHFLVRDGAVLTLSGVNLIDGFNDQSADPGAAAAGASTDATLFDEDAQGGDGARGRDAFGSIFNNGTLTLNQVGFDGNFALAQAGQAGGAGGDGADGDAGDNGRDASAIRSAREGDNGEDGANGGDGGDGGDGGRAATVLNFGSLEATGLAFGQDNSAEGGAGGAGGLGGKGGDGGAGGEGGDGFTLVFDTESPRDGGDGGVGGDTGDTGDGGDGGDATVGILSSGFLAPIGAIAAASSASVATAATGGASEANAAFGAGGEGGEGGSFLISDADDGVNGADGASGAAGQAGTNGAISPLAPGAALFETIILATVADDVVTEGDNLIFSIQRVGVASDDVPTIRVDWRLEGSEGATAADLGLDELPSGEVLFEGRRNDAETFLFDVAIDPRAEADETFTLVIEGIDVVDGDDDTAGIAVERASATITQNDAPPVPGLLIEGTPDSEELRGGGGDDTIRAGQGDDTIRGFSGDDLIVGFAGDDLVRGQRGDDELRGSGGDDRLFGNGGEDSLFGNGGADELRGGGGDDFLKGGGATDRLIGSRGDDTLQGNGRADELFGGNGEDDLSGGGGDDLLEGGAGNDLLRGGGGADVFVFGATDGDDIIGDFAQGEDRISIVGSDGFEDLLIRQTGADVTVSFGATDVLVLNQTEADFAEDDFLF